MGTARARLRMASPASVSRKSLISAPTGGGAPNG